MVGATATIVTAGLFVGGVLLVGAADAWNYMAGLSSPSGAYGYVLSVWGYLVVPVLVGSIAAWALAGLATRQMWTPERMAAKLKELLDLPDVPPDQGSNEEPEAGKDDVG